MTQRQAQRQTVNVRIVQESKRKKKRTTRRRQAPVRQHIMPPPVIQVVQERWFQPPPPQAPQQFHYQPPVLPKQEQNASWESMTAPVENPVGQVVGDLMQQGIEPTEMQGLSARELASIRDSLTSEKVATSTQTIEPAFFVPFTNTREKGTQSAPSTLPMSTQTWGSTSTFGTQTTAPDVAVGGTQTDSPGFSAVVQTQTDLPEFPAVQTQTPPRRLPTFSDATAVFSMEPTTAPRKTLSSSETASLADIPPKSYGSMSLEELKVAVQYKGIEGAQKLTKAELLSVLQSDNPEFTARIMIRGKGKRKDDVPLNTPPNKKRSRSAITADTAFGQG
jgi:hypothetical protein